MSALNILRTALRGILSNKLRAALTMLGVIIGVASVIAMLSIGNGAQAAVENSFRFLGADSIQISPAMMMDDGEMVPAGQILSYQDGLDMPGAVDLVDRVDMQVNAAGKTRYGGTVLDINILGVTAGALDSVIRQGIVQPLDWPEGEPLTARDLIAQGRFFTPEEVLSGEEVCVIGWDTAEDLFQGDNPLDQTVWVNRKRCLVIGVFAELESTDPEERYTSKANENFMMPISAVIQNLYEDEPSVSITAYVNDESRMSEAKEAVSAYLRQRHGVEKDSEGNWEDDFNLTTKQDVLGAQQEAARTFSLLLAAMASISLVVGGIGIMNVMLVSVTERTREIGVRMAIGARSKDVVAQFLLESIMISAGGGLLGVAVGILSIPLAANFNQGMALLDPESIPLSLGVSLLTGLVFGLYPAIRASRLDPIEALRYE